jgi:hypothetical protein
VSIGQSENKTKKQKNKTNKKDVAQKTTKLDEEHVHPPISLL